MNGIKNAGMKSWMTSAFATSSSSKENEKKIPRVRSTNSNKKATNLVKTNSLELAYNQFSTNSGKSEINGKQLLAEKYRPKNRNDLIVNKTKIEQMSSLLDSIMTKQHGSIVIMEGPPGCGKTTILNTLCQEKNIELVQWTQPNTSLKAFDKNNEMEYTDDSDIRQDWRENPYESQSKMFSNFLFKSSRYVADQIFSTEAEIRQKKILFFKDIPMFAFKDVKGFHQVLSKFIKYSKFSMVFSLSNSPNISNEFNPAKIFKPEFRRELGIIDITFNPIATSYVLKHLERIVACESSNFNVDKNFLNEVCLISDGDLRQALNILELSQHNPKSSVDSLTKRETVKKSSSSKTSKSTKTGKQKHTTRQEPSEHSLVQKKDANFSIFRGLGKVLHRKNMEPDLPENDQFFEIENRLSDFHKRKGLCRAPLYYDPDDILAKTPIHEELITLYLHQNYLELYGLKCGGKTFDEIFDSLDSINDNFMCSDMISKQLSHSDLSASILNAKQKEVTALLSIRSVLFHTYVSKEDKANNSTNKSLWMPLHKPYTYTMQELRRKKKQGVHNLLLDNTDPQNIQLAIYLIEMENEFFTSIMPYASMKKSRAFKELASVGEVLGRGAYKNRQSSLLASNENDPSFFMDDTEQPNQMKQIPKQTNNNNLYEYEDENELDIQE